MLKSFEITVLLQPFLPLLAPHPSSKADFYTHFYLADMVSSHNMADIGTCQTIQLLHLFGGIIVVIAHEVSPAQFFKMFLGIIGTSVFSLGRYLMAVGVCPECRLAHAKDFLYIISGNPLGDAVYVNSSTEKHVNMPFAVIVLASDTAHRYLVASGGGVEPRLLTL